MRVNVTCLKRRYDPREIIVAIRIDCTFPVLAQSALNSARHRHPMATAVDKTQVGNRFKMKFYRIIPVVNF